MLKRSSKKWMATWLKEWYPIVIPLILFVGRIAMTLKLGVYNRYAFPSDVCYYGTTFYVWALTTKLSGQKVSLRAIGEGEWYLVIGLLLINFILYIVLYPVRGVASAGAFFASILFAIVFGLLSPIYIRARRV